MTPTDSGIEMKLWPHQEFALEQLRECLDRGSGRICVTSPTGGGKSRMMTELINLFDGNVSLYTNRKLLTEQMIRVLSESDVDFGVRAASYPDWYDPTKRVQLSMSTTENSRVFTARQRMMNRAASAAEARAKHKLHDAQLVLIDEIHMQRGDVMQKIIAEHVDQGATVC